MSDREWDRMSTETRRKYLEMRRSTPLGRKFEITVELCDLVRETMAAGIRARHPGISEEEVRREIIRRTVPPDLRKKAYGW